MKNDTKNTILQVGAEIIHRKGYNHTGIQEVLKAAGVPKGSFYFYFKNKEDFGLQVIDFFTDYFDELAEKMLTDKTLEPLERLKSFFDYFAVFFKTQDCELGCPVGNLAQEMGDLNPAFREKLLNAMERMANRYQPLLVEAQEKGQINPSLDTRQTAYFIISSWHGALIRMKVMKSIKPLEQWSSFIIEHVLK